jgi:predicted glutamine amidotransferase
VLYVASVPLTNKGWTPIAEGTVLAFRRGTEMAGMAA